MANYTNFQTGWSVQNNSAIDKRILLTKAEMKAVSDDTALFMVPDNYFCLCTEDGELYIYNVNNPNVGETGKYKKLEAEGKVKDVLFEELSLLDSEGNAILDILQKKLIEGENIHISSEGVISAEGKIKDVKVDNVSVVDSEGIAKIVFDDWSLKTETGKTITLTCDSEYKLTASLYDVNGDLLSSSLVDLPIEQLIVSVTYDSATKELVITLKNGQVTRVPLGDIISGLATEAALNAEILRATTAEGLLEDAIDSEGDRIDAIEADYLTSIDKAYLQAEITSEGLRIEAIEDRLPTGTDELATKAYVDSEDNLVKAYADAKDTVLKTYVDTNFVKDVQVNGVSKVVSGVANIPVATQSVLGVVKGDDSSYTTSIDTNGRIKVRNALNNEITNRRADAIGSINTTNFDYAVKAALTDGRGTAYTDTEKANARTRIGVDLDALQKKLTAGSNITIDSTNNTISANVKDYQAGSNINFTGTTANPIINAVDTTYTAGDALHLSGTEFNVLTDNNTIKVDGANKLYVETTEMQAGAGIKIQNGIVSTDTSTIPTKTEVAAAYQGKLVAGTNITIDAATNTISAVQSGLTYEIVNALPPTGEANKIYLVQKTVTPKITYEQWMYVSNAWVQLGTTGSIDLSNYYTKAETASLLTSKQDVLNSGINIKSINGQSVLGSGDLTVTGVDYVAGPNISISGRTISATDTTYTAGSGIMITGNVISATGGGTGGANWGNIGGTLSNQTDLQQALNLKANASAIPTNVSSLYNDAGYVTSSYHDNTKQDKLIAGANITITGNTISATGSLSSASWGNITGDIQNQSDLAYQLGLKANNADLANVAKSGNYNDLSNKPTVPTVNNGALTIQQNGSSIASFTANSSSNVVANIHTPTFTLSGTTLYITNN